MADKDYFLAAFERAEEKEIMHGQKMDDFKEKMSNFGKAAKGYFSEMGDAVKNVKGSFSDTASTAKASRDIQRTRKAQYLAGEDTWANRTNYRGSQAKNRTIAREKFNHALKKDISAYAQNNKKGLRNIGITAGGVTLLGAGIAGGVAAHKKKKQKKAEEEKKNG